MKVISNKNLPSKPPIYSTITAWLFLEKIEAPELIYGALGIIFIAAWIAFIVQFTKEEEVDMLK